MRWSFCLLYGILALARSQEPVFKASSSLQTIAVRVTDKQKNPVHGLTAADFTILEDRHPQKIAFFGTEDQPVSLVILLDSSVSMESSQKLERARAVLAPLVRGIRPDDEIFLIPFTDQIGMFHPLSPEQRLQAPLAHLSSSGGGGTALYDAVATALCHLRSARNLRQAMVVITDGADQHSRLRMEQLIHLTRSSKPQIFMIGFWGGAESEYYRGSDKTVTLANGHAIDNPLKVFESIANESGAESFFPASEKALRQVVDHILGILRAEYTIGYYPEDTDKFRKIQVKVHRSGVQVVTRHAVSSESAEGETVMFDHATCEVSPQEHPYPWESCTTRSSSGNITYREDFSNSQSGWPNRPGSRYVSGAYEIYHPASANAADLRPHWVEGAIAAYGPWWDDFRASLLVQGQPGADEQGEGMLFRVNGTGYYAVLLTRMGKPQCSFKLVKTFWPPSFSTGSVSAWTTDIIPWTNIAEFERGVPPTGLARTIQKKITVECKGSQITIWLDDIQVAQIKDYSFLGGWVGMAQFGYGRAEFRDLYVETLPAAR